jgi:hypothetical protein
MISAKFMIKKDGVLTETTTPINPRNYAVIRNMMEDCFDIDFSEPLEPQFAELDEEQRVVQGMSMDTPLHPRTFEVIEKVCDYFIGAGITPEDFEDTFDTHSDTIENYCDFSGDPVETIQVQFSMLHVLNFLNCDCGYDNSGDSYVMKFICRLIANADKMQLIQQHYTTSPSPDMVSEE